MEISEVGKLDEACCAGQNRPCGLKEADLEVMQPNFSFARMHHETTLDFLLSVIVIAMRQLS